jgi:hypothetical protein
MATGTYPNMAPEAYARSEGGIEVTNNVSGTVMVIRTNPGELIPGGIEAGRSAWALPAGMDNGGFITVGQPGDQEQFIITAKFYDKSGNYLGIAERTFSCSNNNGGFNQSWVISNFEAPGKIQR